MPEQIDWLGQKSQIDAAKAAGASRRLGLQNRCRAGVAFPRLLARPACRREEGGAHLLYGRHRQGASSSAHTLAMPSVVVSYSGFLFPQLSVFHTWQSHISPCLVARPHEVAFLFSRTTS
jgi:hypothetical protein